jgi:TonB-dependent SusC/RagA subfamily outer membrane receptor
MRTSLHCIIEYLQGTRKGKEANCIEREALQDPFWTEAFSGYDKHDDDHATAILHLQQQLKERAVKRKRPLWPWMAAACIAIFVGTSILLFLRQSHVLDNSPITKLAVTDTLPIAEVSGRHELEEQLQIAAEQKGNRMQKESEIQVISHYPALPPEKRMPSDIPAPVIDISENPLQEGIDLLTDAKIIAVNETTDNNVLGTTEPLKVITGIISEEGTPLPGVSVSVKSLSTDVLTNMDGRYAIPARDSNALEFFFPGMNTEKIPVAGRTTIDANLVAEVAALEEVVVIGYGKANRSRTKVKPATAGMTVVELLNEKIENTDVIGHDATAKEPVRIRGIETIGSPQPLYIIDGKPVSENTITYLRANDIIRIAILKGAEATALYGLQADDGVLLVTTKKRTTDELPIPVIGEEAYRNYLKQNIQQPSDSLCAKAKGKVKLSFYIDEQGNPFNIEVTTGLCPSCDEEAIRLIKEGYKWTVSERPARRTVQFRGKE